MFLSAIFIGASEGEDLTLDLFTSVVVLGFYDEKYDSLPMRKRESLLSPFIIYVRNKVNYTTYILINSPLQYRGNQLAFLEKGIWFTFPPGPKKKPYYLGDLAHLKRGDLVYLSTFSNSFPSILLEAAGEPVAHHRSRCIY